MTHSTSTTSIKSIWKRDPPKFSRSVKSEFLKHIP
eukprot:12077.XXX_35923_36027_1 [CDS] Oithona nana genome sequencing.